MANCIMVGCDLHDKSMLLKMAVDQDKPLVRSWGTKASARKAMVTDLLRRAERAGTKRIVFAYEACGFGFRLHDELSSAGLEVYVLAPSKMERSAQHRKRKTDERDAQAILDCVRSYVLAGVELPKVWVPDLPTRDDRELVRHRLAVAEDAAAVQVKILWLLKRQGLEDAPAKAWTGAHWRWLQELVEKKLPSGAAGALESLMRQVEWLWSEAQRLEEKVAELSRTDRYASVVAALRRHKGIGILTAMVYLSEMGDLSRFSNRRQVGSYLGLTPSSFETGQGSDRKGHITHQGPSRVRKVLCQAIWSRLRSEEAERTAYDRIVRRNPQHRKIAVVARMRTLGVVLWHAGLAAQQAMPAMGKSPGASPGTRWDPTRPVAPGCSPPGRAAHSAAGPTGARAHRVP